MTCVFRRGVKGLLIHLTLTYLLRHAFLNPHRFEQSDEPLTDRTAGVRSTRSDSYGDDGSGREKEVGVQNTLGK